MDRLVLLLALAAVLQGCMAPRMSEKAKSIIESDEAAVKKCRAVGVVKGYGRNGASMEFAIREAKNDAFEQAADRGATHVVYRDGIDRRLAISGVAASYTYYAYKCTGTGHFPASVR